MQIVKLFARIEKYEGIGDACYNMARAINRKFHLEEDFTEEQLQRIKHIMQLCDSENEINDYRKLLKEKLGDYIVNVVEAHANRRLSV